MHCCSYYWLESNLCKPFVGFTFIEANPTNGLTKESGADAFQVKSISLKRLVRKIGSIEYKLINEIVSGVALCIGYETWEKI